MEGQDELDMLIAFYEENQFFVSKNRGTPKSSILIGFSLINHPFWGTTILETPIYSFSVCTKANP